MAFGGIDAPGYFRYSTAPLEVKSHTFQAQKLWRPGYAREFNAHKSIGPYIILL
jgi:hypothetical protein